MLIARKVGFVGLWCLLLIAVAFSSTAVANSSFTLELGREATTALSVLDPEGDETLLRQLVIFAALAREGMPVGSVLGHDVGVPFFVPGESPNQLSLGEIDAIYVPCSGLSTHNIYVFIPAGCAEPPWAAAAKIADRYRKSFGERPEHVEVYGWSMTADASRIDCESLARFEGTELFAEGSYGYHQAVIHNAADLGEFLGQIDDLVSVTIEDETLQVAGRTYELDTWDRLDLEDIAALYRAYYVRVNGDLLRNPAIFAGRLEATDLFSEQEDGNRYYDSYILGLEAGQQLHTSLASHEFDAYLEIHGPQGYLQTNDDAYGNIGYEYGLEDAELFVVVPHSGTYEIRATSYEGEETGAYILNIDLGAPGFSLDPGYGPDSITNTLELVSEFVDTHGDEMQSVANQPWWSRCVIDGALTSDDEQVEREGETFYCDSYPIDLQAGQVVTVTLMSEHFDSYLEATGPDGFYQFNDDAELLSTGLGGALDFLDAQMTLTAPLAGTYQIGVRGYSPEAAGEYQLDVGPGIAALFGEAIADSSNGVNSDMVWLQNLAMAAGGELPVSCDAATWQRFITTVDNLRTHDHELAELVSWIEESYAPTTLDDFFAALSVEHLLYGLSDLEGDLVEPAEQLLWLYEDGHPALSEHLWNGVYLHDQPLQALLHDADRLFDGFQYPRFTGAMAGAKAGMTLYYCDLLAKLWAVGYSTPSGLGMLQELDQAISSNYWDEIWRYPEGRLWFGVAEGAVTRNEDGSTLFLDPLGVRLFAASTQSSFAEEISPTMQHQDFIDWWQVHWPEIIAYEPQYGRLNQLMKWSGVLSWLLDAGQEALVDDLLDVSVAYDHDFEEWIETSHVPALTYADELPFFSGGALRIIESATLQAFGALMAISGGVSLAEPGSPIPVAGEAQKEILDALEDGLLQRVIDEFKVSLLQQQDGSWAGTMLASEGNLANRQPSIRWFGGNGLGLTPSETEASLEVPHLGTLSAHYETNTGVIYVQLVPSIDFYVSAVCQHLQAGEPISELANLDVRKRDNLSEAPYSLIATPQGPIAVSNEDLGTTKRAESGLLDSATPLLFATPYAMSWEQDESIVVWDWMQADFHPLDEESRRFLGRFHDLDNAGRITACNGDDRPTVEKLIEILLPPGTELPEQQEAIRPVVDLPKRITATSTDLKNAAWNEPYVNEFLRWMLGYLTAIDSSSADRFASSSVESIAREQSEG